MEKDSPHLRYSRPSGLGPTVGQFPPNNFLDFGENATGFIRTPQGFFVFTEVGVFLLTQTQDGFFVKTTLSKEFGCVHPRTVKEIGGLPIWLSKSGVCTFANGRASLVLEAIEKYEETETPSYCVVHDRRYILQYSDKIVVYDFRYQDNVNKYEWSLTFPENVVGIQREPFNNNLMFYSGSTPNLYIESDASGALNPPSYRYETGLNAVSMPTFSKALNEIYLSYKNSPTFSICDEEDRSILDSRTLPTITKIKTEKLYGKTHSFYGFQMIFTGTGTVYAVNVPETATDVEQIAAAIRGLQGSS